MKCDESKKSRQSATPLIEICGPKEGRLGYVFWFVSRSFTPCWWSSQVRSPRMRRASWMSFGMMVTK